MIKGKVLCPTMLHLSLLRRSIPIQSRFAAQFLRRRRLLKLGFLLLLPMRRWAVCLRSTDHGGVRIRIQVRGSFVLLSPNPEIPAPPSRISFFFVPTPGPVTYRTNIPARAAVTM